MITFSPVSSWSSNGLIIIMCVCVCVCVCVWMEWTWSMQYVGISTYESVLYQYYTQAHAHTYPQTIWGQRTDWAGSGHCQKVTALPSSVCVTTNNKGGKHSTQHPRPLVASSDFTVQLRLLLPQLAPQLVTRLTLQHARGVPYSTDHGWFNWQGSKSLSQHACVCILAVEGDPALLYKLLDSMKQLSHHTPQT